MELQHPEYLFGIVAFALLLFLLKLWRKKEGLAFSSTYAVRRSGAIRRLIFSLAPKLLYMGTVATLLFALAAPYSETRRSEAVIEGKVLVPCIDVSSSMDQTYANGRKKLAIAMEILREFLETRSEVDAIGLTAFSGGGNRWGAGIIQYPTLDKELFLAAAKRIEPQMFGGSTAIGEGIFVSILALNEPEWNMKLREETGDSGVLFDTNRLWNAVYTLELPEYGLPGDQNATDDDEIITEAIRLTPPQNGNKVIILFSDGDSNSGLNPIKAIWLAGRLGIKVYYIEIRTPNTEADDMKEHLKYLREAVRVSGGKYYASKNYEEVRNFFLEVSNLEKGKITTKTTSEQHAAYDLFLLVACAFMLLLIALENCFPSN